jgi:hypothetical protein
MDHRFNQLYRDKEIPLPPPIPTFSKLEQANPIPFMNIPSRILNDPGETARPVLEDALEGVKSEVVSRICNRVSNIISSHQADDYSRFLTGQMRNNPHQKA